ncbi:MAG: hypothetical protein ACJA07_001473 [Rhodococcus sp. (in: high G+C Gram-positive bacteria)]
MAEILTTQTVDDLDRSSPAESIRFSYGRDHFVIDLGPHNAARIEADFQQWIQYSRPIRPPHNGRSKSKLSRDPSRIRAWAKAHGLEVSDKGRIPLEVVEAYRQRHIRGVDNKCVPPS